jgi:hypothetical protein
LDNSVDQWKSRAAKMTNWTASQVLAYYVTLLNKPTANPLDVQQYTQLYTKNENRDMFKFQRDLTPSLKYNEAEIYNKIVDTVFFPNKETISTKASYLNRNECLIDLNKTIGYNPINSVFNVSNGATTTAGMSSLLILGLIGAGLYLFTLKK